MKHIYLSILIILSTFSVFAQNDDVIYSFKTINNKVVQLIYNKTDSIFIYRFLSKGKIELEVRDDLKDDDVVFTVQGYHRGGGAQNAAMDYNDVKFSNNGYDYDIYYVWGVNEENPDVENDPIYGIKVFKDGREIADLRGSRVITGEVYGWSFYDILPESKED
jgi:hypothetical protein